MIPAPRPGGGTFWLFCVTTGISGRQWILAADGADVRGGVSFHDTTRRSEKRSFLALAIVIACSLLARVGAISPSCCAVRALPSGIPMLPWAAPDVLVYPVYLTLYYIPYPGCGMPRQCAVLAGCSLSSHGPHGNPKRARNRNRPKPLCSYC
ncbi:hypothetical protein HDV63DRAFT_333091 [Trichoderma sp. SZMC 28014]